MKTPKLATRFYGALAVLLALDAYVVFVPMCASPWWLRVLFLIPSAIYICAVIRIFVFRRFSQQSFNQMLWLTLTVFFGVAIFDILSWIGLIGGLFWTPLSHIFNLIGLGVVTAWFVMAVYGALAGWKRLTTESVDLPFPDLPADFDGYKIVHLSDFHIGTYDTVPGIVDEIVERVNNLRPDLIVFTGDLVNRESSEIDPFVEKMSRLHASDGVLSVLGNHDYCFYRPYKPPHTPAKECARLVELQQRAGWRVLMNEAVTIRRGEESIAVVGVENAGSKGFLNRADLGKALSQTEPGQFKILLSHDPSHWRREVVPKSDVRLMLAGHTHGMQFKLGAFTPSKLLGYREWGGVYRLGRHTLVVSTGIGGNVAFRFGVYPQILLLNLHCIHY